MNSLKNTIILGLITILSSTVANASTENSSQYGSNSQQLKKVVNSNNPWNSFRPPGKSQPQYTVGGATRGNACGLDQENNSAITALVPAKEQSLTLQSHPTFFAYVSPMNEDKTATFIVKDQTEDYYYSQQLTIPASGGLVKMTLDQAAPQLKLNKDYTWFLRIQCNADLEPEDPQINASVKRVASDTPNLLSSSDLVSYYANSQIWYDSLNYAFELYESGDEMYWFQLLNNIGLDRLITKK